LAHAVSSREASANKYSLTKKVSEGCDFMIQWHNFFGITWHNTPQKKGLSPGEPNPNSYEYVLNIAERIRPNNSESIGRRLSNPDANFFEMGSRVH
jgi:hypothetical protein